LALEQLLLHPEQMALLVADPSRAMQAVEEGMRFAPLPWALPHRALRDVTRNGLTIRKDELAMVLIPSVNRDPAAWQRPNEFDITRPRQRNFSFGYGMHACPGSHLARMEMSIALQELTRRLERIELVDVLERDPVQKGETPIRMILNVKKRRD
jgi:cytochrome P450